MKTRIVNLFGGPGIGKSTLAAGIFHEMKSEGYSVELVDEYAKQLTWEERQKEMVNQIYIFAKQYKKLERLIGKVDYVITDSPLLLSLVYPSKSYFPALAPLVEQVNNSFDNRNIVLERTFKFVQKGRNQNEYYAKKIDARVREVLKGRKCWVHSPDEFDLVSTVVSEVTQ